MAPCWDNAGLTRNRDSCFNITVSAGNYSGHAALLEYQKRVPSEFWRKSWANALACPDESLAGPLRAWRRWELHVE